MNARHFASSIALCAALSASSALAQQQGGFALDRFDPSERGSDWFSQESLDLRGNMRPAFGVVADYAHKPLVLYDGSGDEITAVVRNQMFLHLGGSLVLWDRVRFGLNLPVAVWNNGDSGVLNGTPVSGAQGGGVGDLRLGADVRLLGEYGGAFNLALGAQVHVPTGSQDKFLGDGKARVVPRLMAAGDIGAFAYAANVRLNYRAQNENVYGSGYPFGTELGFGAAAGLRILGKKLLLGPEIYGSTVMSDGGDGVFKKKTTPFELVFGGHYTAGDFRVGLGAGPGLSRGIGAPDVRLLASLEWFPQIEEKKDEGPADRDGDGVLDKDDACVDEPGEPTSDPKTNGCPPPKDRDGDGVLDDQDACPDVAGVATDDPKTNGCPPPGDRDKDGILDEQDACPDEPGVKNDDPKKNGCPPKDTDEDTFLDDVDACPTEKGVANEDPKKHGCPKARLVGKKIEILDRIEFDTAKATIRPESEPVLNAVLSVLKEYPGIKKLSIEGHTDNQGNRAMNVTLSKNRAASVLKWLVAHGIDKARLASTGFGPDKPRDSNATDEGRQNNRRVEFNITEGEAVKTVEVPADKAAPANKAAPTPAPAPADKAAPAPAPAPKK